MLDSRPCGARMTGWGLGLDFRLRGNDEIVVDSRLCGNDEGVVDSRLCGGGNDGGGSCGGGCFLAIGCKKDGAENQAQEGYCRLPIADCRLPIADCRLPILRQRRLRSSYSGWFVSCLFLCVMPMTSATDKSHYTQKTPNIKFFCKKTCHSRPRLRRGNGGNQLAAGRRILRRRKPPVTGRGFYIPVILATAGIHPFAIFPFARSANGDLSPKMANPLRRQSRR